MARTRRMTTGQRIAAWREIRNWPLRKLSKAARMSTSALWRVENDAQQLRYAEAERLASALGITMAQFAEEPPADAAAGEGGGGNRLAAAS